MLQPKKISLAMLLSIASFFYITNHAVMPTTTQSLYASEAEVNAVLDHIEKNNIPVTIFNTVNETPYVADLDQESGKIEFAACTTEGLINRYNKGRPIKLSLNRVDELQALLSNYVKNLGSISQSGLELPIASQRPLLVLDCKEGLDALTPAEIKVLKSFFIVTNQENYRIQNIFDKPTIKWPTKNVVLKTLAVSAAVVACVILGVVIYRKLTNKKSLDINQAPSPIMGRRTFEVTQESPNIGETHPHFFQSSATLANNGILYNSPRTDLQGSSQENSLSSMQVGQTTQRMTLFIDGSPLTRLNTSSQSSPQSESSISSNNSPSPLSIRENANGNSNESRTSRVAFRETNCNQCGTKLFHPTNNTPTITVRSSTFFVQSNLWTELNNISNEAQKYSAERLTQINQEIAQDRALHQSNPNQHSYINDILLNVLTNRISTRYNPSSNTQKSLLGDNGLGGFNGKEEKKQ